MLLSLYTGLVAAVDVQSIQFKYTCSVSVVTDPSIHPTNHPSIKQQWRRRSLWRFGMLPRSLPLSFSGVSHLIGRQMSAKEISPRALNTLRQLLGTGRLPHHPPSLPSISFCVHSIQLNADDSGSWSSRAYQGSLSPPIIIVMVKSCVVVSEHESRRWSSSSSYRSNCCNWNRYADWTAFSLPWDRSRSAADGTGWLKWTDDVAYGQEMGLQEQQKKRISDRNWMFYVHTTFVSFDGRDFRSIAGWCRAAAAAAASAALFLCFDGSKDRHVEFAMQFILCSAINWTKDWIESYNSFRDMHTETATININTQYIFIQSHPPSPPPRMDGWMFG